MGTKRNIDMSSTETKVKIVKSPVEEKVSSDAQEKKQSVTKENKKKVPVQKKQRSKRYQQVRSQIDKTKLYSAQQAIELVKKLSYSKFPGMINADLVLRKIGEKASFSFPYATGKTIKVAIVSTEIIDQIAKSQINFDVLLATPQDMPKITKFARVLGPKGLMPNPKNGTLTPKPELKKKELESGKISIQTEKKAPLMHVSIGKTAMKTEQLVANLETLTKALKGKIIKLAVSATMSPGVKVIVD